jgi:tryptophan-rich sensory protein
MANRVALAALLAASAAAQGVGAWLTLRSVRTWYPTLARPAWTPPDWVFGPVWTLLYVLMAVAAWLVWRERSRGAVVGALRLYGVQLVLNVLWSALFFGMRSPGAGLIGIGALWAAIGATLVDFWRIRRLAGWLLVPYLFWVGYAAGLNWALWRLND